MARWGRWARMGEGEGVSFHEKRAHTYCTHVRRPIIIPANQLRHGEVYYGTGLRLQLSSTCRNSSLKNPTPSFQHWMHVTLILSRRSTATLVLYTCLFVLLSFVKFFQVRLLYSMCRSPFGNRAPRKYSAASCFRESVAFSVFFEPK